VRASNPLIVNGARASVLNFADRRVLRQALRVGGLRLNYVDLDLLLAVQERIVANDFGLLRPVIVVLPLNSLIFKLIALTSVFPLLTD